MKYFLSRHFFTLIALLLVFNACDALLTSYAVNSLGAFELNPFIRPIAGDAGLFLSVKLFSTIIVLWAATFLYTMSEVLSPPLNKFMLAMSKIVLLSSVILAFLTISWSFIQVLMLV